MSETRGIRINKYLSEAGVLSRRKADEAVQAGEVMINGEPAVMGSMVGPDDTVTLRGRQIDRKGETRIFAYFKPIGLVCTAKEADKKSIYHTLTLPVPCMYVGRLDKDSQGLLLLTNDGDLSNRLQKARNHHEKEYVVRVDKPVTQEFLSKMSSGVEILDTVTRPCKVKRQGQNTFRIILTQGLNRQIRRMCEALDYKVVFLKRIRECNILLGDLKPGEFREILGEEFRELMKTAGND
ncbi:MAG: pseudouridine synthase [Eubacterium sp.]|nr:pseudouridine synthase [Eubacterium sp.]